MTRKQIALAVANCQDFFPDKYTVKKDGTVEFYKSYFYKFGRTADSWGMTVKKAFPRATVVKTEDRFASWPKTSYFVATVKFN